MHSGRLNTVKYNNCIVSWEKANLSGVVTKQRCVCFNNVVQVNERISLL